ncbi:MAG: adenylate/guanylate cyclase domain-containing protein [Bacteroidota bacterium]
MICQALLFILVCVFYCFSAKAACDSTLLNKKIETSKEFFNSNPDLAIQKSTEALEESKKCNLPRTTASALKNLGIIYYNKGDYINALENWNEALNIFSNLGDLAGVANIESNLGAAFFNQGDDATALEYYLSSLKKAESLSDTLRMITLYQNIGTVYLNKKATHKQALDFFLKAYALVSNIDDNDAIGTVTVNIGELYLESGVVDTALYYFEISAKALEKSENLPYTLLGLGKAYTNKGDFSKAESYQYDALTISKKLESKNDIALSLIGLGKTNLMKNDFSKAITYYGEAENLSRQIGASYQLKDAFEGLAKAYSLNGQYKLANQYQDSLLTIKDTLFNLDIQKKLGTLQFTFDIEKKESEINLLTKDQQIKEQEIKRQKLVRNGFIGGFAIVLLFAGVFLSQRNRISKEKKRSDELLLNILPEETAEELKATGSAKAKSFDSISVLFTDFKNFTQASEILSAEELVEEINQCYSEFDRIVTKHGLEKIKTIGDSYMCAGGIPTPCEDHAERMVKAALEMQAFIETNKANRINSNLPYFELRLGIHSGPVVAGVVGTKKFAYDIWGDTVNTASRMESSGAVGKVNISEATYALVKDKFKCTPRGKVAAKNKGEIEMYFVEGALA